MKKFKRFPSDARKIKPRKHMSRTDLSEEQWRRIAPLLPVHVNPHPEHRGRPWCPEREVLNGILWVLITGAAWRDLPERYPSKATCHRRFQAWSSDGTLKRIFEALLDQLDQKGKIHWEECFMDGSFRSAKKGALYASQLTRALDLA